MDELQKSIQDLKDYLAIVNNYRESIGNYEIKNMIERIAEIFDQFEKRLRR